MSKTLFMETTKIPAGQTVSEIQHLLGKYGAAAVMTEYEDNEVKAVCFQIMFLDRNIPFRLPCRWESIEASLNEKYPIDEYYYRGELKKRDNKEQAKRVAWRQILRWVEAQLALVETNMVKIQEVFLPYVQVNIKGETFYDQIENKGFKMLGYDKGA